MAIESAFQEFGLLFAISAIVAVISYGLRQPLIVGFIVAGVLAGPWGLGLIREHDDIELFARIGIALLLFIVGLRLDPQVIRTVGPAALATGLGQVVFTSVIGYAICLLLGFSAVTSAYVAVALTFSSTIIIIKLLTEKNETESLHGRIAVGFLLVQDVVVIAVMIAITALNAPTAESTASTGAVALLAKGAALIAAAIAVGWWIAPRLGPLIAQLPELLTLVAVAWAVGFAAASEYLGFSQEIGAFLAGVALSSSPFRDVLSTRLAVLRDILLLFFFIELGAQLELGDFRAQLGPAVILSVFVLVGNPVIVLVIMGAMGFRRHTGFMAGLTVAQISEFSLIFVRLGFEVGHVSRETVGLVTLVGIITIGLSTYMILYSEWIFARIGPYLRIFERSLTEGETRYGPVGVHEGQPYRVVVFGVGRHGTAILRALAEAGVSAVGIDFSPETVRRARADKLEVMYGDVEDLDYYGYLPLHHAEWIICTLPHELQAKRVQRLLKTAGVGARLAFTAHTRQHEHKLSELNVDYVFNPFRMGAETLTQHLGLTD